jgi:Transposase IS4
MMRFDDKATRDRSDRFSPIRELFEEFVENCKVHYTPGHNICIDESLRHFEGRCSFRQYMPSKACRYGLKFWNLVDTSSHYMWNAKPYLGRSKMTPKSKKGEPLGEQVVMDLAEGLLDAGRILTVDNFFTSIPLAQRLHARNTLLVGTIKSNKPELPKEFLSEKVNVEHSKFIFNGPMTLVKCQPKKKKTVLLLSTKHHTPIVESRPTRHSHPSVKPAIVHDYNAHKSGVDMLDFIRGSYSVDFRTRR